MKDVEKCRQQGSTANDVKKFYRLIFALPDMFKKENWDRFVDGLKNNLRIEGCRDLAMSFEDSTQLAVRMDLVLNGGRSVTWGGDRHAEGNPVPMKL